MKPPCCRCKHAHAAHIWTAVHFPDGPVYTGEHVCWCGCRDYRYTEATDAQTWRGILT